MNVQQKQTNRLDGEVIRVGDVTTAERNEMFTLMSQYYENINRLTFETDFAEKDWVIVARDGQNSRILGFSTQVLLDVADQADSVPARPRKVLFSGDTIIDREYWGRNPLVQLWGRLALTLIDHYSDHDVFWFLISKGYKTYRFLPVFFHEFYPHFEIETPSWAGELIQKIACQRYPDQFDSDAGIIRAGPFGCQLRAGVAELTSERLKDKHVEFFRQRNPHHELGDELCCIAPLTRENFKPEAYRVIGDQTVVRL